MSEDPTPVVYFIKEITPENIIRIYEKLGREAKGKVGVKISLGEPGGHNFLNPQLIKDFVHKVNGTIVENNCLSEPRGSAESHLKVAKDHGFLDIANVDILDAEGEVELPVPNPNHLKHDIVGKGLLNYDFIVVLSHFKGHAMGGLGGALKNVAIGFASKHGKSYIHSAGAVTEGIEWETGKNVAKQDDFLESMAEACSAVFAHLGERVLFINIANNLSVDCDCDPNPASPCMKDIGIFASLDPVAVDKACIDAVYQNDDAGKAQLIERMESRHGIHTLEVAEKYGLGSMKYKLVTI